MTDSNLQPSSLPPELSLDHAVVVVSSERLIGPGVTPVSMLVEEVEKRTQIRWPAFGEWPVTPTAVIAVGTSADAAAWAGPHADALAGEAALPGAEGYRIRISEQDGVPVVLVAGSDERGVLFGVGRLLRLLRMRRGSVRLPADVHVTTTPGMVLRGHQLGYRPKTNSYDGWTLAMWEQYLRDLVVFGSNAIELIPPRSDDDADSPHFPLPPMETMVGMSRLADAYGLNVWVWYPALDVDYTDPGTVETALSEWEQVFRLLPRIDAVFVPGGDPGHTAPGPLMALLEKQAASLRRHHPEAGMWVAPQGFGQQWLEVLLGFLREEPEWLTGVVYGPQTRVSLPELRAAVPERYPIRHYPDITHCRQCQYPVPDWDVALALTEGREPINPRPLDQARIFRLTQNDTVGFICYSEGCNDDVNKAVWSALGWDPEADLTETIRDYSRYFIGPEYADAFAHGLLALERNWRGPLIANRGVETTLHQFQGMERTASPALKLNWRFQQALYRAYYDAYIRRRLLYETELEARALDCLRAARRTGSLAAMTEAERLMEQAVTRPVAQDLRARVFELAEALFQSIRMQLSVERYAAIDVGRGANLDTIDVPLNDAPWLKQQFAVICGLSEEGGRLRAIEKLLCWTDPGPGGFYADLGDLARQPHLMRGLSFVADPEFKRSALTGFSLPPNARLSWCRHAETLWDTPLTLRYEGLDPEAQYRLRVVYAAEARRARVRLTAGDGSEIHPFIEKPCPIQPLEFNVPRTASISGELTLVWQRETGLGGNGRGCQVAEVWLMRAEEEEQP